MNTNLYEKLLQDKEINEISKKDILKGIGVGSATIGAMFGLANIGRQHTNQQVLHNSPFKTEGEHVPQSPSLSFVEQEENENFDSELKQLSQRINFNSYVDLNKIIYVESSGRPHVSSGVGARGLMQLMRNTWGEVIQKLNVDWDWDDAYDPYKNIIAGTYYINHRIPGMLRYYGIEDTIETRIAAYNWGIGNLNKIYKKYGKDNWFSYAHPDVKDYVKKYKETEQVEDYVKKYGF